MRYTREDKRAYLRLCQLYNAAEIKAEEASCDFVLASLQLHAAKATVPKSWRTRVFVRECGSGP